RLQHGWRRGLVKGIDYAWGRPKPASIAAAGYTFVARYLSHDAGKNLTKAEADKLLVAGLDIVTVWETTADRAKSGAAGGQVDGAKAKGQAEARGAPPTAAIYFAVHHDAAKRDLDSTAAYATAIAHPLAPHPLRVY